jgi:hypothetical protein
MAPTKLLIIGSTGYMYLSPLPLPLPIPNTTNASSGGSVLNTLLSSENPAIKNLQISALVRGEDKAALLKKLGVAPILFTGLDDGELLTEVASQHDSTPFLPQNPTPLSVPVPLIDFSSFQ